MLAEVHEDAIEILYGEMASSVPTQPYMNLSPERLEMLNSLWEELKIESPISTVIIVITCLILVTGAFFGSSYAIRRYRQKRIREALWG